MFKSFELSFTIVLKIQSKYVSVKLGESFSFGADQINYSSPRMKLIK